MCLDVWAAASRNRHEGIQRDMESGFCVLSDTEDLQMLISNTATNLHNERWVESRCWFIVLLLASV